MGDPRRKDTLKKFMRQLLAATCLTAAGAVAAHANVTVTEVADFSDDFLHATPLPPYTDTVIGQVFATQTDLYDFFQFSGLTPFAGFNVHFTSTSGDDVGGAVFNSSDVSFGTVGFGLGFPRDIGGTIPVDGILVVEAFAQEGGPYTATLTTSPVPEPAMTTLSGLGLLLAGGLARRRRQKQ